MKTWSAVLVCVLAGTLMAQDAASSKSGVAKKTAVKKVAAQSPGFVGNWKLDAGQSVNGNFKAATLHVTKDTADAIAWVLTGTGNDGKPVHERFASKKGIEAPIDGMKDAKATFTKDNTLHFSMGGAPPQVLSFSLSDDRKTIVVTGKQGDKDLREVWTKTGA
jgi:hypothetical protein